LIRPWPYQPDPAALFTPIADLPWAVFLDSGSGAPSGARYHAISALPDCTLVTIAGTINIASTSGVNDLPSSTKVNLQAAPNPFNPATRISFDLPEAGEIALTVFDTRGRRINTLLQGWRETGTVQVTWNGTDQRGQRQPGGVYLFVLDYGADGIRRHSTKKVVLLP